MYWNAIPNRRNTGIPRKRDIPDGNRTGMVRWHKTLRPVQEQYSLDDDSEKFLYML